MHLKCRFFKNSEFKVKKKNNKKNTGTVDFIFQRL